MSHKLRSKAVVEGNSTDLNTAERLARANALIEAIAACDWRDAEVVLSAFLEEYRAGPPLPALIEIEDEADFWVSISTYDELMAYFIACGRKLVRRNFGRRGRVQLAARALEGLSASERQEALAELATPMGAD